MREGYAQGNGRAYPLFVVHRLIGINSMQIVSGIVLRLFCYKTLMPRNYETGSKLSRLCRGVGVCFTHAQLNWELRKKYIIRSANSNDSSIKQKYPTVWTLFCNGMFLKGNNSTRYLPIRFWNSTSLYGNGNEWQIRSFENIYIEFESNWMLVQFKCMYDSNINGW